MHEERRGPVIFSHMHDVKGRKVERGVNWMWAHWGSEQQEELRYMYHVPYHTDVASRRWLLYTPSVSWLNNMWNLAFLFRIFTFFLSFVDYVMLTWKKLSLLLHAASDEKLGRAVNCVERQLTSLFRNEWYEQPYKHLHSLWRSSVWAKNWFTDPDRFCSIFHHRNWRAKGSCDVDIDQSAGSMVM